MANPFPFVAGQVLTAAQMNGIGEATAFTPTLNNVTVGNGTLTGSHVRVNKLCFVQVQFTLGSTSSVTGSISFNLPFTAASTQFYDSNALINDAGTSLFVGFAYEATTTTATLVIANVAGTYPLRTSTSATVPMTWATGDNFSMSVVYEVA